MRRFLAILLLCVFGLPLASPLFVAAADQDAGLPACCRRNGVHHCFMTGMESSGHSHGTQLIALREKCPAYPAATTTIRHNGATLVAESPSFSPHPARPAEISEKPTLTAAALDLARHERGPPSPRA
jgi:hypothetical protein